MPTKIRIRSKPGKWVLRAGGAILGETQAALELAEEDRPEVLYFPRADLAMALLEPTETRTTCPWKGEARYFSIHTKSTVIEDAAWSYEDPKAPAERIRGYVAFFPDKVTIEEI